MSTRRGTRGGYALARPAANVTVADILRAVDGPLAVVRDETLEGLAYSGAARNLPAVWREVHMCLGELLERVTIADLVTGECVNTLTSPETNPKYDLTGHIWMVR